jgi:BCCT family betaine/carnitine transporter
VVAVSLVEPIYYLNAPPFGVEPRSALAVEWASVYGAFHWGPIGWAIYTLPAVAIAYAVYVEQRRSLRFSSASQGLLGRYSTSWPGAAIDVFVVAGIVGGTGTSLGLGIPLVSGLLSALLDTGDSFSLRLGVVAVWTLLFGTSVSLGLKRGIRVLAGVNVALALALLGFVLAVGPTAFILALSTSSFGLMLDSFFRMSLWLDPVTKSGFPEEWTLFYWAWWIAYAPMLGLFVARISRGRTIRQLVLGEIVWGSLGCAVFYWIWGSYALHLETSGLVDISGALAASGIPAAVIAVLGSLPGSTFVTLAFTILCFVFLATTLDSAAYVIASVCTRDLPGDQEPARWNRLAWAGVLALVATGLLAVGGVKAAQTSTVVVALPLIPILVVLTWSLMRWLRAGDVATSDRCPDSSARGSA